MIASVIVPVDTGRAFAHHDASSRAPLPLWAAIGADAKALAPDGDGACWAERGGRTAVLTMALGCRGCTGSGDGGAVHARYKSEAGGGNNWLPGGQNELAEWECIFSADLLEPCEAAIATAIQRLSATVSRSGTFQVGLQLPVVLSQLGSRMEGSERAGLAMVFECAWPLKVE